MDARKRLKLLVELLTEDLEETPEEVDAYLRAAGYDPDALVARMRQKMKKAMDKSPLNPKNQQQS